MDQRIIVTSAFLLITAGVTGGLVPLFLKVKEAGLHYLLALGTGMLLGTIFLHMLPDAISCDGAPILVLVGLLIVFVVEKLVFGGHSHDVGHDILGLTAFFGLSVHAMIVGLGLSAQLVEPATRMPLITSLVVHKFSETFSLATVFILAGYSKKRAINLILIFSAITPLTLIIGFFTLNMLPSSFMQGAAGIAAGTFLYVALLDLLPEVFHHPKKKWVSFGAMLIGIAVIWTILNLYSHSHSHIH